MADVENFKKNYVPIINNIDRYFDYNFRLATFKNWPYRSRVKCNSKKMASAGFIYAPSQEFVDNAVCIICWKELANWDPNDDPLTEHKLHSPNCDFLKSTNMEEENKLKNYIFLVCKANNNFLDALWNVMDQVRAAKDAEFIEKLKKSVK